jgi:hypothetical protein
MSKIINLKEYELVLTYSWHKNNNQGICGHTFEVIEYFWILKDHFNVCILMADNVTLPEFIVAIKSKYDFSESEIKSITDKIIFKRTPLVVLCNNILFTDGAVNKIDDVKILYNKMFLFSCGYLPIKDNNKEDVYILQDHRVYEKAKVNSIEYVKKMLFSRFKKITSHKNKTLIYATKNCRALDEEYYKKLLRQYDDDFIVLTNEENKIPFYNKRLTQMKLPVVDIFEQFNKYIYTPIERQFDCSPRFIAECRHYGIEVIYDVDYEDKGLEARISDLENISKIMLDENDNIIKILKDKMCIL